MGSGVPGDRHQNPQLGRSLFLDHIVSPFGIALVSLIVFLAAWTFPPGLYTGLIGEPDLMFLDAETLLFFLLCVLGFCAGVFAFGLAFPSSPLSDAGKSTPRWRTLPLLVPLAVTTVFTLLATRSIFQQIPNLLVLLASQQGSDVKDQMAETLGVVGWGANVHIAVLWWTYWNLSNTPHAAVSGRRNRRVLAWTLFFVALLVEAAFCIVRVARGDFMPVLAGLGILILLGKIKREEISPAGLLKYIALFPLAAVALFSLFALTRGTSDLSGGVEQLAGYTFASYNRLTSILRGNMRYPYGGHGVYLFMFLDSSSIVNAIIPVRQLLGWPTFYDLWKSEFQAPQLAGLNASLIWAGTFGYLYSDFGWFSPLILVVQGVAYGFVWKQVRAGTTLGLILYPWFGYCALCWFTTNTVFDFRFPFLIVSVILLILYERVFA